MLVYVIDINGQPLMPTERCGKVRRLLKDGKAKVLNDCPFTIQLLYETTDFVQDVNLGVDAGSKHVGVSATTKKKELYASEVELRNDVVKNLSERRELRGSRRNRKTRYRQPRFNNRKHSKPEGWIAPSVRNKIDTHMRIIDEVRSILPVSHITVETASFDIQKIKNPDISGTEYQEGEQLGFWNVREYVLFRDGHQCQCCKGKSKDKILETHHIVSRQIGGDAPNNLITLCKTCHDGHHAGTVRLPSNIKRGMSFRDAAFMGIMRWAFYDELKELYPNKVSMTYGYITKNTRITHKLPKTHAVDARCISGNPDAKPLGYYFFQKKVRCHNRQIHKLTIGKGGVRKNNQATREVKGFRLFDKVLYNGEECFIFARRTSGYFDLRYLDGTKVHASASYKNIKLQKRQTTLLTERRMQGDINCQELGNSSTPLEDVVSLPIV